MKTSITPALFAHLQSEVTTLAVCWRVVKRNGGRILSTEHDRDLAIDTGPLAGVYLSQAGVRGSEVTSNSDMSVDNMEVEGAARGDELLIPDVTVADMESGVLDKASVTLFVVNWQAPNDGALYKRHGFLGNFERDSNGQYRTEVRGLTQLLSQNVGQTYGETCNVVVFGDARCKKDLAPITRTGTITAVTSRKRFTVLLDAGAAPLTDTYYDTARTTFTSGDCDGFNRQVKHAAIDEDVLDIELLEETPADVAPGDTFILPPGCDRRYETCKDVHNNLDNMRAYGVFIPGVLALLKGAT
jgi:uncharacterized phage protein (TIGR02218 family)